MKSLASALDGFDLYTVHKLSSRYEKFHGRAVTRTQGNWVRSANATSVLCRPQLESIVLKAQGLPRLQRGALLVVLLVDLIELGVKSGVLLDLELELFAHHRVQTLRRLDTT